MSGSLQGFTCSIRLVLLHLIYSLLNDYFRPIIIFGQGCIKFLNKIWLLKTCSSFMESVFEFLETR